MKIRNIRNAAIGHPTKHEIKKSKHYNYISRMSLAKTSFTLMRSSPEDTRFLDVDVSAIIAEQLADIETALNSLAEKLKEADRMHKEKFRGKQIADVFHSATSYLFEKIAQGIHSPSGENRSFALSMLGSIEKIYIEFESAMVERSELNDCTRFDLDEYKHGITMVREFLSENPRGLGESDARIYLFYLRQQHDYFVKIAQEVDDDYKNVEG